MAKNYFILRNSRDLENVYNAVILWFKGKQYEVEGKEEKGIYFIQARKTGVLRTITGTNLAFRVKIYRNEDKLITKPEFVVESSRGKWIQNIAGAGFFAIFGGITIWTGLAGAGWSFLLENELISHLKNDLNLQPIEQNKPINNITINPPFSPPNLSTINLKKDLDQQGIVADLEAEIDKLEQAFSDEILTQEEFIRKKSALEKRIDDYEVNFVIEDKISKLQEAFSQGVLDQFEYEEKLQEIETTLRQEVLKQIRQERNKKKIIKLKEALNNGIITQKEYEQKITALS